MAREKNLRPPGTRHDHALREIAVSPGYLDFADGSCLITWGRTRIICAATVSEQVPPFRIASGGGWVTGEYAMLPGATHPRSDRESLKGRVGGRTLEIQRLIGRSLRAVVDLAALGPRTVTVDCDVIQADGGTRTASITGAFVALCLALEGLRRRGAVTALPLRDQVAAVSVGLVGRAAAPGPRLRRRLPGPRGRQFRGHRPRRVGGGAVNRRGRPLPRRPAAPDAGAGPARVSESSPGSRQRC